MPLGLERNNKNLAVKCKADSASVQFCVVQDVLVAFLACPQIDPSCTSQVVTPEMNPKEQNWPQLRTTALDLDYFLSNLSVFLVPPFGAHDSV